MPNFLGRHSRVVLAVVSALVGATLGAGVQEALNSELRLLSAVTCAVLLAIIGVLAGQATMIDSQRKIVSDSRALVTSAEAERHASSRRLDELSKSLTREMTDLEMQFGLRVDRLLLSEVNAMTSLDEDASAQLIFSAEEELCVLDIISEHGRWPDESMDDEHSDDFFNELIGRVKEADPPISYKRIVQVKDPSTSLRRAASGRFINHCHNMLEVRSGGKHKVSLRVTRMRFPFKFMLIDKSRLVLQLQEYEEGGDWFRIWGEILINDPKREFVSIFREIWDQIDDDPLTRTVTAKDLPIRGGPSA